MRLNLVKSVVLTSVLLVSANSYATPPYQRLAGAADNDDPLIVAGYRAIFTCSAHFLMGRPLNDIKRIELVDVEGKGYPDPIIDEKRRLVFSSDPSGSITRVAAYRDSMGCTILPPQWQINDVPRLPYVSYEQAPNVSHLAFPDGDKTNLPASGIEPRYSKLSKVLDQAFDGITHAKKPGTITTSVLVIKLDKAKGGQLVAERYRKGFGVHSGYRTWSTSKSIFATLMGIASRQGLLQLDQPVAIPEWPEGDARKAITYQQLMWMSSGLYSAGPNSAAVYFGGQDVISAATGTSLEVKPGTRWQYANNDTLLLVRSLRYQLNDDLRFLRFPYDELLHPLGMYHTRMEVDHLGTFVGSSQTYTTARDLARFGIFLANDGVHKGKRYLPEDFIRFISTPAPTKPPVANEWGYGAQFWLLDTMPDIPKGTFTTFGNKGQYVTVVPGHDLVIVRTGVDPNGIEYKQDRLVADVLKALSN